ncbi:MAG: class I SAM-dependent methyltransferase [Bdellovibrionota bacterium]
MQSTDSSLPAIPEHEQRLNLRDGRVTKIPIFTPELEQYVHERCFSPHPVLKRIRDESVNVEMNYMMTERDQAALLNLLVKISGTKKALEIGCYLGYSTLAIATALPNDGTIISLDHNPEWSQKAKTYFEQVGLHEKIDLRIGEALDLLKPLSEEILHGAPKFNLIFIDADKKNAFNYYKATVDLLETGGILLIDNVLWRGHILDKEDTSDRVWALRELNDFVTRDPRVEAMILTLSDGMLLLRKK